MYQALLTCRYLFTKVMPLLASVGVMLCTVVVLVTWSVMGGFLNMLINTGRTMTGDVVVRWPGVGFPYYEDLMQRLGRDPAVEAAAPCIEAFGMISLPDGSTRGVMVRGVDGPSYARVTKYADILWWRPIDAPLPKDTAREDPRLSPLDDTTWSAIRDNGLVLQRKDAKSGEIKPAIVPGIHATQMNRRDIRGFYVPRVTTRRRPDGTIEDVGLFMPRDGSLTLTLLPLDRKGQPDQPYSRVLPVANEFQSGVFDYDANVVLVNLSEMQRMLRMNEGKRVAEPGGTSTAAQPPSGDGFAPTPTQPGLVTDPARVTDVLVRGKGAMKDPAEARALKNRVLDVYAAFAEAHRGEVPDAFSITILTWEEQNATFIHAVRNEISLLLVLFSIVCLTVVFLVIAIFWSMVREKTMDIGVLRAVGAGRGGVAGLWLTYGLAIGLVGSSLGLVASTLLVRNINPIHEWLGDALGIVIWDPQVYYFTKIPAAIDPSHAVIVFVGGVLSCVVGALIPALRAAYMQPVRALRNE
jgi:lipoprotein-releasing system permease protein